MEDRYYLVDNREDYEGIYTSHHKGQVVTRREDKKFSFANEGVFGKCEIVPIDENKDKVINNNEIVFYIVKNLR